ncbi:ExeM/NucH family extracellular endonuclease [Aquabacterium sp. A7-Y]|uniref:ExeM/NucH family extracellular endonuclease n=1 Tax=Aquabacterium sp. A7-Y TaxID=1349605 RepID=UPI00223E02BE|nr:ExeM/NucH family extracellular endonuclease [Aquabacterium sp. A7-Y]MCW7539959.1 ExeM/NucH family extracellular endonuclease [Aquabacterium sp. A7-Y]
MNKSEMRLALLTALAALAGALAGCGGSADAAAETASATALECQHDDDGEAATCSSGAPNREAAARLSLPACPAAPQALHDITSVQGSGSLSPLEGRQVTVRGVVTADFQGNDQLKGFFIQQPVPDRDPATSEGLFVYAPGGTDVKVGDYVQASGTVVEFKSGSSANAQLTELSQVSQISICGSGPKIRARVLKLPLADRDALEPLEGMLTSLSQKLSVTEVYQLGRYGELALSLGDRLYHPNNHPDGPRGGRDNTLSRLVLDDGRTAQNPKPIPYLSAADTSGTRRVGDRVSHVRGVLSWGADAWRLHPVQAPVFESANPRTRAPEPVGGTLKVGSLNVLNYFTTLNQRGANSTVEFERQRTKLVEAIAALDADVLGLMEIENNGTKALADLVAAVNAKLGAGTYAYINAGRPGSDQITVAMIYKPERVRPVGNVAVPDDPGFSVDGGLRPPVAQRFAALANEGGFWMVVNHLKSKGSCPDGSDDPNRDLGQGCWNTARTTQAQALQRWVAQLSAASGETDVLMMGDFNSYLNEDPIRTLEAGGFEALLKRLPPAQRYTYVFSGESGALDHAFASASLRRQVSGLTVWHINADEPLVLDYNTEFKSDDRYAPTPWRSSDHDPVLVGLKLKADAAALLPRLEATLPASATVGVPVQITGISAADGNSLSVDWGDGSGPQALALAATSASHTYAAAGRYTVRLRLADAQGRSAERSGVVTVGTGPGNGGSNELFFSEYVEGSSNNKALELYNPTGAAVDLSNYTVKLHANGGAGVTQSQALSGTLAPGATLVLVHPSFAGNVQGPAPLVSSVTNFNGDDTVVLEKSGRAVDAIGQLGHDPGTAWTHGTHSTLDRTLRRKPGIVRGSIPPAAPAAWDLSAEWSVHGQNDFSDLGRHQAD